MQSEGRVVRSHRNTFDDPIKLEAGKEVTTLDRDTEWIGWLWCKTASEMHGWIPEAYLERNGDTAVLMVDYDATEPTVEKGDMLTVLGEESEWIWCRTWQGDQGWILKKCVEFAGAG